MRRKKWLGVQTGTARTVHYLAVDSQEFFGGLVRATSIPGSPRILEAYFTVSGLLVRLKPVFPLSNFGKYFFRGAQGVSTVCLCSFFNFGFGAAQKGVKGLFRTDGGG